MKYEIGQKVRVKGLTKVGQIMAYKIDGIVHSKGNIIEVIRYEINFGSYYKDWYYEKDLLPYEVYEFDAKFEKGLKDLLIDTYLLHNKLDAVKLLVNSEKAW